MNSALVSSQFLLGGKTITTRVACVFAQSLGNASMRFGNRGLAAERLQKGRPLGPQGDPTPKRSIRLGVWATPEVGGDSLKPSEVLVYLPPPPTSRMQQSNRNGWCSQKHLANKIATSWLPRLHACTSKMNARAHVGPRTWVCLRGNLQRQDGEL